MKDGFLLAAAAAPEVRVADCAYNAQNTVSDIEEAKKLGVRLLVFPELGLTGYTVGDLVFQRSLLEAAKNSLLTIAEAAKDAGMLVFVGLPFEVDGRIYNCAAALYGGRVLGIVPKTNLPNYSEFYEQRWFEHAPKDTLSVKIGGCEVPFGTKLLFRCKKAAEFCVAAEICEDIWVAGSPSIEHTAAGATVLVNLSASNDFVGKDAYRRDMVRVQSAKCNCAYIYASCGRGESTGDVVFSGHRIIAELGGVLAESRPFGNDRFALGVIDFQKSLRRREMSVSVSDPRADGYTEIPFDLEPEDAALPQGYVEPLVFVPSDREELERRCELIYNIQTEGLMRRVQHVGSKKLILGVSGGQDSTLALTVCCLALDKLGRPRSDLIAVTMPCFGTSKRTRGNAEKLCEASGADFRTIDISEAVRVHLKDIGLDESDHCAAYENAQARERTQVLMDLSNKENGLVVGTGDLSELAQGFATYNGDHMSMYAVNCSVPKTLIPSLLAHAGRLPALLALADTMEDVVATPVSPELLPPRDGEISQITENVIGPYELSDFYLYYFMRWGFSPRKILRMAESAFGKKYDRETLIGWMRTFYRRFFNNQFKRSCLPDGPKIGSVSLSPRGDWRMPSDACSRLWLDEIDEL